MRGERESTEPQREKCRWLTEGSECKTDKVTTNFTDSSSQTLRHVRRKMEREEQLQVH